jgi:hypothetical protein
MAGWLTAGSGLAVAAVGATLAYFNSQRLGQRQARLDRVNKQLEELYGPMLSLSEGSSASWAIFRDRYRPGRPFIGGDGPPPTSEEVSEWIAWMRTVFMPANRTIHQLIVTKTHLLDDDEMPAVLLVFLAHVSGYEVTMSAWDGGDFSRLNSLIDHPGDAFTAYTRTAFSTLKHRQQELLGATKTRRP